MVSGVGDFERGKLENLKLWLGGPASPSGLATQSPLVRPE